MVGLQLHMLVSAAVICANKSKSAICIPHCLSLAFTLKVPYSAYSATLIEATRQYGPHARMANWGNSPTETKISTHRRNKREKQLPMLWPVQALPHSSFCKQPLCRLFVFRVHVPTNSKLLGHCTSHGTIFARFQQFPWRVGFNACL